MLYRTLTLLLQYFDFTVSSTQLISVISSCNEAASSCDCFELEAGSSGFVSSLAGWLSDAEEVFCSAAGSSVSFSSIGSSVFGSDATLSASVPSRPFSSSMDSPNWDKISPRLESTFSPNFSRSL